jgi:hypothetical protein
MALSRNSTFPRGSVTDNRTSGATTYSYYRTNQAFDDGVSQRRLARVPIRQPRPDGSIEPQRSFRRDHRLSADVQLLRRKLSPTELSGRAVGYGYDAIYRLTSEGIASDLTDFFRSFSFKPAIQEANPSIHALSI